MNKNTSKTFQGATNQDIIDLKSDNIVLRSDFKDLRSDFKDLRSDFKDLRSDFKGLRSDYKRTEKYLRHEMLKLEERIENIEDSGKRIEGKLEKLGNVLDGFVKGVDDLRVENTVGANQIYELQADVASHGVRIKKIESAFPTHQ